MILCNFCAMIIIIISKLFIFETFDFELSLTLTIIGKTPKNSVFLIM